MLADVIQQPVSCSNAYVSLKYKYVSFYMYRSFLIIFLFVVDVIHLDHDYKLQ